MRSLLTVSLDAREPGRLARFWAALLDDQPVAHGDGWLLPGTDTRPGLRFVPSPARTTLPSGLHLHLTSAVPQDQGRTVARALGLGASHLEVGQTPEEGHVVLTDLEGNPFCVIEAGNRFLAGCGLLGEVACEGSRAVGVFWSRATGWPLVWDQDQETAIQSPDGGTKVAWSGQAPTSAPGTGRRRLELTAGRDPDAEIERLVGLGATRLGGGDGGGVRLADPDGQELLLRS